MLTRAVASLIILPLLTSAFAAEAQSRTATIASDQDAPGDRPRHHLEVEEIHHHHGDHPAVEAPDHESVVGHLGVGWFGVSNILVDFTLDGNGANGGVVAAPVLGVRYWLSSSIGIDVGLGVAISGSAAEIEASGSSNESDGPSTFGLLLHGGLPLALKSGRHYTFLVVPEINLGFASVTRQVSQGGSSPVDMENSGFRFDLGGRAGAEVQFGFIDIPELALEASVGLYLTRVQAREEISGAVQRVSQTSITTTSLNNPWDFFRTTVAARYYF